MAGCGTSGIGVYVEVSDAEPVDMTPSTLNALNYTEVGHTLNFPQFGGEAATISNTPMKTGEECKTPGSINWGQLALNALYIDEEAGHAILQSAFSGALKGLNLVYKVYYPNGAVRFLRGYNGSYKENPGDSSSQIMMDALIELNYQPVYLTVAGYAAL